MILYMMRHTLHNKSKKGHKHTKSLYISIKSKSNDYQNKNKNMVHRINQDKSSEECHTQSDKQCNHTGNKTYPQLPCLHENVRNTMP